MAASFDSKHVFINCPFDGRYQQLFEALVFAVADCGFRPRCALESQDSGQVRIEKILDIIGECRFGIHDISRTELDTRSRLPRFNMPLELGLFLGARRYGNRGQRDKVCLVLDSERYRYQRFISDISGQDIKAHGNEPARAIGIVRDWLRHASSRTLPGGKAITRRYEAFRKELPTACRKLRLSVGEMTFTDFTWIVWEWLRLYPALPPVLLE